MNQASVNTIYDLLSTQAQEDPFFILCCSKAPSGVHTVHAIKPGQKPWANVPPSAPISANEKELTDAIAASDMYLGGFPRTVSGCTYYMAVRFIADFPINQRVKVMDAATESHDRIFEVQPQKEIVDLLSDTPENIHIISMGFTIDFDTRTYTAEFWRYLGYTPIEIDFPLDPLRFDAALRLFGWRMSDPPHFNIRNNYTGYARGTNKHYTATIVRNLEGERYMLSSQTDRQEIRKKEIGSAARLTRQLVENSSAL